MNLISQNQNNSWNSWKFSGLKKTPKNPVYGIYFSFLNKLLLFINYICKYFLYGMALVIDEEHHGLFLYIYI